jgi:hypothetical protein
MRAGRGHIIWYSDGSVKTKKGTSVSKYLTFRGRRYTLVGATGSKREAESSATLYRRQFGRAVVRRLEPGNFGIYAGGRFGK